LTPSFRPAPEHDLEEGFPARNAAGLPAFEKITLKQKDSEKGDSAKSRLASAHKSPPAFTIQPWLVCNNRGQFGGIP
jgi:hypothetical protein